MQLQIYLTESPPRRVGAAWVKLRVRRQGFLNGAFIASGIVSLTLLVFAIFLRQILNASKTGGSSGAVTALVLLPTVLAAYIAWPGEHALTSRVLRVLRVLLTADGGLTFLAALRLLTVRTASGHHLFMIRLELYTMAGISVLCGLVFLVSNVLPRPRGDELYWRADNAEDRELNAPKAREWPPYDGLFGGSAG